MRIIFSPLLSPRDRDHARATEFAKQWDGQIITTRWVLAEVADGLASPPLRSAVVAFLKRVEQNPFVRIIPASDEQYARGFDLYGRREDKDWSLTDCVSFVAMADESLTEALTGGKHFEQ